MPTKEEKKLIRKIRNEYLDKGRSYEDADYIAKATVYGKDLVKKRVRS